MIVRRARNLTVLFVLALCACFAASAHAEQRASTCVPEAGTYSDAHCINNSGSGAFKLVLIPSGTEIKTTTTNTKTASGTTASTKGILKGAIAGLEAEIECATASGSGSLVNGATSSSGTGILTYSGCSVLKPAGRNCKVATGSITTNTLRLTTAGQTGGNVKVEPNSGTEFASIPIENCLNNKPPTASYPASGSFVATGNGATATTTHAGITAQGTLTLAGSAAGIEGSLTTSKSGGNPIT